MTKPHKWAEVIKAWADGNAIQSRFGIHDSWTDVPDNDPNWSFVGEWRIKPEKITKWLVIFKPCADKISFGLYDVKQSTHSTMIAQIEIEYAEGEGL